VRAGIGAAAIALVTVLMLAGGNDVVAKYLNVEVDHLNVILRWLVFLAPVLVGAITWWICRDLGHSDDHPISVPARMRFRRNVVGGFDREADERPSAEVEGSEP
jgi:ubiquinol-cytochrome c reductase cytochrome b subunit